jgi:hypothetical protein
MQKNELGHTDQAWNAIMKPPGTILNPTQQQLNACSHVHILFAVAVYCLMEWIKVYKSRRGLQYLFFITNTMQHQAEAYFIMQELFQGTAQG